VGEEDKLKGLNLFDGNHFTFLAHNSYVFEMNHAFFPLLPYLQERLGLFLPIFGESQLNFLLQQGFVALGAFVFYKLSCKILPSEQQAFDCTVLYSLNHALLYSVASYSEPLFNFLTFTGFYVLLFKNEDFSQDQAKEQKPITSLQLLCGAFCFGTATLCRSTGILALPILVLIMIGKVWQQKESFCKVYKYFIVCALVVGVMMMPFITVLYWKPWELHCDTKIDRTD